jgi:hydroxyacid-oxoacid transhydrogenase
MLLKWLDLTFGTAANAAHTHTHSFQRFGTGVTREVGQDLVEMGAKHVCVFTDPVLKDLPPVATVLQSLHDNKVAYTLFDQTMIEPTDASFKQAIKFVEEEASRTARGSFDAFVAVGGGSVIDTAKAANLYSTYPPTHFLDYVNPPIGKGLPPPGPLKPLIAIPTTAGTGSEATGVAVFDLLDLHSKTGIAHRRLKPTLGIIDPDNARTMSPQVATASGFDVLCHALESYTAIPYNQRSPRPKTPLLRPAYQGSNPIADVWSLRSLEMLSKYFVRSVLNRDDAEASAQMMLAATYAGIGFGSAGVHLCHGMSYPVSSLAHQMNYYPKGYRVSQPMIPHGMSVVLHAPAVFRYTAPANPHRHLKVAEILGADVARVQEADTGKVLAEQVIGLMQRLEIPNGLSALGFKEEHIGQLVQGTLPQHRVIKLAPRPTGEEDLHKLFRQSLKIW